MEGLIPRTIPHIYAALNSLEQPYPKRCRNLIISYLYGKFTDRNSQFIHKLNEDCRKYYRWGSIATDHGSKISDNDIEFVLIKMRADGVIQNDSGEDLEIHGILSSMQLRLTNIIGVIRYYSEFYRQEPTYCYRVQRLLTDTTTELEKRRSSRSITWL